MARRKHQVSNRAIDNAAIEAALRELWGRGWREPGMYSKRDQREMVSEMRRTIGAAMRVLFRGILRGS